MSVCPPVRARLSDPNPSYRSPGEKPHTGGQSPRKLALNGFAVSSTVFPFCVPKVNHGSWRVRTQGDGRQHRRNSCCPECISQVSAPGAWAVSCRDTESKPLRCVSHPHMEGLQPSVFRGWGGRPGTKPRTQALLPMARTIRGVPAARAEPLQIGVRGEGRLPRPESLLSL